MRVSDPVGRRGEELAVGHLVESGFEVLGRNWHCETGEIDIVARDGDVLVVCEVKTRTGVRFGSPLEAVTWRKAARLRRLAGRWLDEHDVRVRGVRIDVVGVLLARGGAASVDHVRGVD